MVELHEQYAHHHDGVGFVQVLLQLLVCFQVEELQLPRDPRDRELHHPFTAYDLQVASSLYLLHEDVCTSTVDADQLHHAGVIP